MEDKKQIPHVQVPNYMGNSSLEPKDQLIYTIIKSYDNPKHECFPSLQTISKESGASINTIRNSIKRLKEEKYIKTELKGRKTYYTFNEYKKFEPFSPDFIKREDLTFVTKSYLIATQQYMYKNTEGIGKVSYPNTTLSAMINMPESTIRKCNRELESKNYLQIVKNEARDIETGIKTDTKIFELSKLGQAIIWSLANHEERIQQNTNDIDELKRRMLQMEETNRDQAKLIKALLKKLDETTPIQKEYPF